MSDRMTVRRPADVLARSGSVWTGMEGLESRRLLSSFVFQDLGHIAGGEPQDHSTPIYILRPAGERGPQKTISSSVAEIGDVNGDGFDDILIGSGGKNHHGRHGVRAVAAVYSGQTGEVIYTLSDGFSEFGASVASAGDVNGDGINDVLVGSPRFSLSGSHHAQFGRVYLYSGASGDLIRTFDGTVSGGRFGESVAGIGDFNHDGTPDILVGAPSVGMGDDDDDDDDSGPGGGDDDEDSREDRANDDSRGAAYVFSGSDGALLATFNGQLGDTDFGYAVAGAGDLNGDGFADLIVGAPHASGGHPAPGKIYVFSGQDQSTLFTFTGDQPRDLFGFSVAGGSDVNGDLTPDIVVGAPFNDFRMTESNVPNAGRVTVFSGADGSVLFTVQGNAARHNLGAAVAFAGDVNGDGHADIIIGSPSASPDAKVIVVSGVDGSVLDTFVASESGLVGSDRIGTSVAAVGDVNHDGIIDFVFGATQDANPFRNDRSRFYVFSGAGSATMIGLVPEGLNDGMDVWGTVGADNRHFLILNGELFVLTTRPGFSEGDRVVDVNEGDTVLGVSGTGETFLRMSDGTRTLLSDLVTTFDGPAGTFTTITGVDITDSGLILVERLRDDGTPTTWLYENGTLTFINDGRPVAMNEARTIISIDTTSAVVGGRTIVSMPSGAGGEITGFTGIDLNEGNVVVGTTTDGTGGLHAATWSPDTGSITDLGQIDGGQNFVPTGIDNDGEVVGTYTVTASGHTSSFYFRPDEGISDIQANTIMGASTQFNDSTDLRLVDINNAGLIAGVIVDADAGFTLRRFDGVGPFAGDVGGNIVGVHTTGDRTTTVVTMNPAGEVLVFTRDAAGNWSGTDLAQAAGAPLAHSVVGFTNPQDGSVSYALVLDSGVAIISRNADGRWVVRNLTREIAGSVPIVRGLTTLTSQDGFVLIAGLDARGDVVIYGQTSARNRSGQIVWAFDDLSQSQLRSRGLPVPSFAGDLIAYTTAWNGLNIAGIDNNGNVQVVWTAPGLSMGGWVSSDLTAATGASSMVGGLSAYLTPWGGINLAGVDDLGNTSVVWWVPSMGARWDRADFTAMFGGPRLRAESVTSYVTPWGGLNVAGIGEDGRLVIYWWAPGQNAWEMADMTACLGDRCYHPVRRLDSYAAPDGSLNVFGAGMFGDVIRMHWEPGGSWQTENLTELA